MVFTLKRIERHGWTSRDDRLLIKEFEVQQWTIHTIGTMSTIRDLKRWIQEATQRPVHQIIHCGKVIFMAGMENKNSLGDGAPLEDLFEQGSSTIEFIADGPSTITPTAEDFGDTSDGYSDEDDMKPLGDGKATRVMYHSVQIAQLLDMILDVN